MKDKNGRDGRKVFFGTMYYNTTDQLLVSVFTELHKFTSAPVMAISQIHQVKDYHENGRKDFYAKDHEWAINSASDYKAHGQLSYINKILRTEV